MRRANERLPQFPNAALSAEIAKLSEEANRTSGRPEGECKWYRQQRRNIEPESTLRLT